MSEAEGENWIDQEGMASKAGRNFEGSSIRGWDGGSSEGRVAILSSLGAHR